MKAKFNLTEALCWGFIHLLAGSITAKHYIIDQLKKIKDLTK